MQTKSSPSLQTSKQSPLSPKKDASIYFLGSILRKEKKVKSAISFHSFRFQYILCVPQITSFIFLSINPTTC